MFISLGCKLPQTVYKMLFHQSACGLTLEEAKDWKVKRKGVKMVTKWDIQKALEDRLQEFGNIEFSKFAAVR